MTAHELLSRVRISVLYRALTGVQPRRSGRDKWRGPARWRGGDNQTAIAGDDRRGLWHDYVTGDGGGVLDLVQKVLGGSRADALRYVAELAGVSLDDRPPDRAVMEAQAAARRVQRGAGLFAQAAIAMCDLALRTAEHPNRIGLHNLRRDLCECPMSVYMESSERNPRLALGLVRAGRRSQKRRQQRLASWLMQEVRNAG